MMNLDGSDSRLLAALQEDAHLTAAPEPGELLHLSPSQAGRRRQRLEARGFIENYTARLCPQRLRLAIQALVQVEMSSHQPEKTRSFTSLLATRPEVFSARPLSGQADYLLRVVCNDLVALNRLLHDVLLPHVAVARLCSQIVRDQLKPDAALPT